MISKKIIVKIAKEIEKKYKESKKAGLDTNIKNSIVFLWKQLKEENISNEEFSKKLGETLKKFGVPISDKQFLNLFLKKLTGEDWKLTQEDFAY